MRRTITNRGGAARSLVLLSMICLMLPGSAAAAGPEILTADAWRADLDEMVQAIREHHFQPFRRISEEEFLAAASELRENIPRYDDVRILLEMAELVASLRDAHTRLALPRVDPSRAMVLHGGHAGTAPPSAGALRLAHLPVRFELFDDGLFVTRATEGHEDLLGAKVEAFGEASAEDAVEAVRLLASADNDMTARWYAPDRLALPAVLEHAGLTSGSGRARLTVSGLDGSRREVTLEPPPANATWIDPPGPDPLPLARRHPDATRWIRVLPEERALYLQIDELEGAPDPLPADWVRRALAQAEAAGAERVILDLRQNFGGTGSWNEALVKAFAESPYNEYGRLFVLIGRRTFSAAFQLVEKLEILTQALFVGEPTGSGPGHFGDPEKLRLTHSGLTLRVSTLYWSGTFARDFREAIGPHLPVPTTGRDHFAGRDPVLEAALGYEPPTGIAAQVEDLLRRGRTQEAVIHFARFLSDPNEEHGVAQEMTAAGHRLLDDELVTEGFYVFTLSRQFLPDTPELLAGHGKALELRGDREAALEAYRRALELDPDNRRARAALRRLAPDGP